MSIKKRLSSSGFRFVSLYVLVYLLSALGFVYLMFSLLGTEIEESIKRDIQKEFAALTENITPDNLKVLDTQIDDLVQSVNPLENLYILKTETGDIVHSNYPYETRFNIGWEHLNEIEDGDEPVDYEEEEESFWEDLDFYPENSHDAGYIGYNGEVGTYTLFIGQSLDRIEDTKNIVARIAALIIPISIFLAFLGGLIFNRMTTKRIEVINNHCRTIRNRGDLSLRVPNEKPDDEYGLLIANMNAMLDAIDKGVKNVEAVSDDIAHDLRTPLSRMKYALEAGLSDETANTKTLKQILKSTLGETDTLLETFSAILRISQLDSGRRKANFQNFNITELVETLLEAYEPTIEDQGHKIGYDRASADCFIFGDKEMIGQLLSNLIENALQHGVGPENRHLNIGFSVECKSDAVRLTVVDDGRGIATSEKEKIFDKFYRGDYSRGGPGSGLGLALVKAVADLHDADIQLVRGNPGLKFVFSFPRLNSSGL